MADLVQLPDGALGLVLTKSERRGTTRARPRKPGAEWHVDSAGVRRRLCDMPKAVLTYWDGEIECSHYAKRQLPDGRWVCAQHDPDRSRGRIRCSQPTGWDERGNAVRFCSHYAKWVSRDPARGDGFGLEMPRPDDDGFRWFCTHHDPERPRCDNAIAHPPGAYWKAKLAAGAYIEINGGPPICPRAPHAVRKLFGVRLCAACSRQDQKAPVAASTKVGRVPAVPCVLCRGTCALEDDHGRPFPCVCTPGGREMANGAPDHVVIAQLVQAGLFEPSPMRGGR